MFKTFAASALAAIASAQSGDAMIGTNIGGWMVLEPWITPTLFYRFLGKTQSEGVGMDQWSFCEALGDEANDVLKAHWDSWVTEDLISQLADREVEILRVPIGDWTINQYGAYVGCTDGAAEYIDQLMDWCETYNIKVLLDIHGMKDSQNGFDNSGNINIEWQDENNFKHWSVTRANWLGTWEGWYYSDTNWDNVEWSVDQVTALMNRWGSHPALYALEAVNEPWWASDLDVLKEYYTRAREAVRAINSDTIFVFHDAFQPYGGTWNDLFDDDDMDNVVMDNHTYFAWWERKEYIGAYCDDYGAVLRNMADIKYPIWVGEWSLATDVCAIWLGGFQDSNNDPYQFTCTWQECPYSYLNETYAVDFDRTAVQLGPYGESNTSTMTNGTCPLASDYFTDDDMATLGSCAEYIFDDTVQGQFMWTAHNELENRWSYIQAYDNGWLKTRLSHKKAEKEARYGKK